MNQNEQNNVANSTPAVQTPQPVQQQASQQTVIKPNQGNKTLVVKKNNKVMLLALLAIAVIGLVFFLGNTKVGQKILGGNNSDPEEYEIIKIDTSQKWGDRYAIALQESFLKDDNVEINGESIPKYKPSEFGITFVDFQFDGSPEMIVKYTDSLGKEAIRIFQLNNSEVSETKDFKNADFRMVYSIREKTLKWYVYITSATSKKYGAYTTVEKILNSTAFGSDIQTTTDVEVTTFNVNYITSDYRPSFYGVEVKKLEEDFKAAVLRYESTNDDAEKAKKQIEDNYGSVNVTDKEDENDFIVVGRYTLKYGTYSAIVEVFEQGVSTGTREDLITINKNGTVKIGEDIYKFSVYGNLFVLSNDRSFTIVDNDKFVYGQGTGQEYKFKE